MFNTDNYFCCKCGRDKTEDYTNDEGNYKTRINDFTLIDGNVICKQCWYGMSPD